MSLLRRFWHWLQRIVPLKWRAQTMGLWAMTTLVAPIMVVPLDR